MVAQTRRDSAVPCARFVEPVIGHLVCQDIKVVHLQAAVNAAPTAGEGRRVPVAHLSLAGAGMMGGWARSPLFGPASSRSAAATTAKLGQLPGVVGGDDNS